MFVFFFLQVVNKEWFIFEAKENFLKSHKQEEGKE